MPVVRAVRLRMHQERGAAVQFGADEIQPALGLLPALHHHVFQLFVQEFFGRLFVLRIHFHVIGQHAQRLEVRPPCPFPARRTAASPIPWCRCDAPAPAPAIPCARESAKLRSSAASISRRNSTARGAARPVPLPCAAARPSPIPVPAAAAPGSRKAACAPPPAARSRPRPPALHACDRAVSRSIPARYSSICAS